MPAVAGRRQSVASPLIGRRESRLDAAARATGRLAGRRVAQAVQSLPQAVTAARRGRMRINGLLHTRPAAPPSSAMNRFTGNSAAR